MDKKRRFHLEHQFHRGILHANLREIRAILRTSVQPFHERTGPLHAGTLPRAFPERVPLPGKLFHVRGQTPYESPLPDRPSAENHSILVKDCSRKKGFEGREFIRIAVRDATDNDALVRAMHAETSSEPSSTCSTNGESPFSSCSTSVS